MKILLILSILIGTSFCLAQTVKLDENGNILWSRSKLHSNSNNQLPNVVYSYLPKSVKKKVNDVHKMDSIITSSVQGGSLKVLFEYSAAGDMTEQLIFEKIGNTWFNDDLHHFDYDENGNLVLDLLLVWQNSQWDSLARINYTYNAQGLVYQYVFQDYSTGNWVDFSRGTFEYDSSGNETVHLSEKWQGGNWHNETLFSSYYSDLNLRDSLIIYIWDSIEWQNYYKTIFNYNTPTNFLDYFVTAMWTGNNWQNYLRRNIVNDSNGNEIEQLDLIWNYNSWGNSSRRFYSYIELNCIENAYCELWTGSNWVSGNDYILLEYPNGFRIRFTTHTLSIYYKPTNVNEHILSYPKNFVLEQNYPNPFNPSTKIKYSVPQSSNIVIKVFDILGNEIETLVNEEKSVGSYEVEFSADKLPSGIYFYRLQVYAPGRADSFVGIKKMVLLR